MIMFKMAVLVGACIEAFHIDWRCTPKIVATLRPLEGQIVPFYDFKLKSIV